MVRGGEVLNDATMRDAQDVHLQSICHVTVSYTHLDVYKRQLLFHILQIHSLEACKGKEENYVQSN